MRSMQDRLQTNPIREPPLRQEIISAILHLQILKNQFDEIDLMIYKNIIGKPIAEPIGPARNRF